MLAAHSLTTQLLTLRMIQHAHLHAVRKQVSGRNGPSLQFNVEITVAHVEIKQGLELVCPKLMDALAKVKHQLRNRVEPVFVTSRD